MKAKDLHKWVLGFNWDEDLYPLLEVVENPNTDYGTALLIFWRSGAPWIGDEDLKDYAMLRFIIHCVRDNLLTGYYRTKKIEFYPIQEEGLNTLQRDKLLKAGMPVELLEPVYENLVVH